MKTELTGREIDLIIEALEALPQRSLASSLMNSIIASTLIQDKDQLKAELQRQDDERKKLEKADKLKTLPLIAKMLEMKKFALDVDEETSASC